MSDDPKIRMPEWARHMYNRLVALINAGGGGGGGEENVIEAISFNGANVQPDANKRVSMSESDPTVPSWAKQSSKPTYTAQEVGAIPTTQKGAAGGVAELDSSGKVPSSQLPSGGGEENVIEAISFNGANVPPDANKRVSMTETDPTVPSWAKAETKPSYTAQEVGALPASTPIPTKTSDLTNDSGFLTSSTGVTGVKGNAESSYRHGNVNLTPANIGAVGTGDIIDVSHGGTGASNAAGARSNLGAAALASPNNLLHAGNEFTFASDGFLGNIWFNYRTASGEKDGNITGYTFGDGKGGSLASITANTFSGNAANVTGTVAINHGGTGATSAPSARNNLGVFSGQSIVNFSNGAGTIAFSTVGISSKPAAFVATASNQSCFMRYDFDETPSSGPIKLYCIQANGTGYSGNIRFSWICIP